MYFLTLLLHYTIGYGILKRLGFGERCWEIIGLAFPLGLGSATLLLFLLEIFSIPLTFASTTLLSSVFLMLLFLPEILRIHQKKTWKIKPPFASMKHISLTEWLMLGIIAALFFISAWRCFYFPVKTYDSIVGIDLVAKYAVEDEQFKSRIFSELGTELSTQPYYAPFAAMSQILYLLPGLRFGKIWLSVMFLSLLIIFYGTLRKDIHPVLAGALTLALISIPEMYAYTYLLQTDFANAVFVCISLIYLYHFIRKGDVKYFWVSALLFGLATWTRSETISFAGLTSLLLLVFLLRQKRARYYLFPIIFFGINFMLFGMWNLYFLPIELGYSPESYFKVGFWDFERLDRLWGGMIEILTSSRHWGYIPYIFLAVCAANLILFRDQNNLFILLWIVFLFLGFVVLLYHLQLHLDANIKFTFRRGTFKLWPMMIFYIGTSELLHRFSNRITEWEKK